MKSALPKTIFGLFLAIWPATTFAQAVFGSISGTCPPQILRIVLKTKESFREKLASGAVADLSGGHAMI